MRIFAASSDPSQDPAPMMVWISSIKSTTSFSSLDASSITIFIRFSNSPRYFVPAIIAERLSDMIRLDCIANGTFPSAIRRASHSTTAVFPTPGSPTRHGLFLVFRLRIEISLSISVSRPIIGSILFARASAVKSVPKKSSAGVSESFFSWGGLCWNGFHCPPFSDFPSFPGFIFPNVSSIMCMISSIGPKIPF